MRITRDGLGGLMLLAIGAFALVQGMSYPIGTARRMGPGFFPIVVAAAMLLCGAVALLRGVSRAPANGDEAAPGFHFLPLLYITAGIVAFGLLVERAGLVPATFGLVVLACAPRLRSRPIEVLVIFVALSALLTALFIGGLGLPIRAFG